MTCVVGRIDVYHLNLAEITFLQELEHFEVVSLDIEVLSRVPVDAFFLARTQSFADRAVRLHDGCFLANPCELICLVAVDNRIRKHLLEQFEIDNFLQMPVFVPRLRDAVWEQRGDFSDILLLYVLGLHSHLIHYQSPPCNRFL